MRYWLLVISVVALLLFAVRPAFVAEPTFDNKVPSGTTLPQREIDKDRRGAMLECPPGSGAYCPISTDCLCIDDDCSCIKQKLPADIEPADH